jgi:hypothetical protein
MKNFQHFLSLLFFLLSSATFAQIKLVAGCSGSTSQAVLDIGNVRATILHAGDMWWDLIGDAQYEVPKNSGKHSLFAGSLWMGGLDAGGNLRVAAQTYRQTGDDFWAGPIDTTTVDVTPTTCNQFDRFWTVTRQEVLDFIAGNPATADMISYPGNGSGSQAHFLAPFFDNNGDGIYSTSDGDYPQFDYIGSVNAECFNALHGDQAIWYVYNDVGNIHTETGSANPLGIEIHEQAFAFNSLDSDVNNATFYQYKIINRNSTITIDSTYLGAWTDPDLGNSLDDFVGCDVRLGLGFAYNADEDDEGTSGYGLNPPAVGIDFLNGPFADVGDGIDNDRDSCIDCTRINDTTFVSDLIMPERIIMSNFIYYNNDFTPQGNPQSAADFYGYLKSYWIDGTHVTFGGDGYGGGLCTTTIPCNFIFPGTSDPYGWSTGGNLTQQNNPSCWNWSEETAGNFGDDRRFLQSAGPFTLQPGEVQFVTTAAIWARAVNGGRLASVAALKGADDKIQTLSNNCWDINSIIHAIDAGVIAILSPPADTLCDSVITPIIRLENFGTDTLFSVTINYQIDGNPVQSFTWNGALAILGTDDITLPMQILSSGNHTITVYTDSPNSSQDQYTFNDASSISFAVATGIYLPVTEGFEATTFPPASWTFNSTASSFLRRSSSVGGFGNSTASMIAACYFYPNASAYFSSSRLDISNITAPASLTFSLAYAERSDTSQDTLEVYASTDCGNTFTLIYSKTDSALATTSIHSSNFTPLSSEWRTEMVDLSSYIVSNNLHLKFYFHAGNATHRGNNIYVDDINIIGTPVSVNDLYQNSSIKVYPNPVKENFYIQLNTKPRNAWLEIFNIKGQRILLTKFVEQSTSISTKNFAPGIYFVKIIVDHKVFVEKLVIE